MFVIELHPPYKMARIVSSSLLPTIFPLKKCHAFTDKAYVCRRRHYRRRRYRLLC